MSVEQSLDAFVKAGVIHHDHALGFEARNERDLAPVIKYIPIDLFLEVIKSK